MNKEEVVRIREELGVTQGKFAELAFVTRRTVINWEQGKKIPDSKVQLFEFLLEKKRNNNTGVTVIDKTESITTAQTIDNLNREIYELKDHIKTLRDLVDEKTIVAELYKTENLRMKDTVESLKKD